MSGKLGSKFKSLGKAHDIERRIDMLSDDLTDMTTLSIDTVERFDKNEMTSTLKQYVFLLRSNIKFTSLPKINSNLNANLNRIRMASSVLRNVKDYMTECKDLCTKGSDETITASQRNNLQIRIKSLLRKSIEIQQAASFNKMKIFNLGGFSLAEKPSEIDSISNPSKFDANYVSWKAQIGFDTGSTYDYKIQSWGSVLKNKLWRAPCTSLKLWDTNELGFDDEGKPMLDRYGKYICGDYLTWATNILIFYNKYSGGGSGLQGTYPLKIDNFKSGSNAGIIVALAARIAFGIDLKEPGNLTDITYNKIDDWIWQQNDLSLKQNMWNDPSKSINVLNNVEINTNTFTGPVGDNIGNTGSLTNNITQQASNLSVGDMVLCTGDTTNIQGNKFKWTSELMSPGQMIISNAPATGKTFTTSSLTHTINVSDTSTVPPYYSRKPVSKIVGTRNIEEFERMSPWKIKYLIKKDSSGNMFKYEVFEESNALRKDMRAVSVFNINTNTNELTLNTIKPKMKLVGVRYATAYATTNKIRDIQKSALFNSSNWWHKKRVEDAWVPSDKHTAIYTTANATDAANVPSTTYHIRTGGTNGDGYSNGMLHTWGVDNQIGSITPWNLVGNFEANTNPFLETDFKIHNGDILELDMTYPFYRLEVTKAYSNDGTENTVVGSLGFAGTDVEGDHGWDSAGLKDQYGGKIYVKGLDLLPGSGLGGDISGGADHVHVDPITGAAEWGGYHIIQHNTYHRGVVIKEADEIGNGVWVSPPVLAYSNACPSAFERPHSDGLGGSKRDTLWTEPVRYLTVNDSGDDINAPGVCKLDWTKQDMFNKSYIRINEANYKVRVGDVLILANLDHPLYNTGMEFTPADQTVNNTYSPGIHVVSEGIYTSNLAQPWMENRENTVLFNVYDQGGNPNHPGSLVITGIANPDPSTPPETDQKNPNILSNRQYAIVHNTPYDTYMPFTGERPNPAPRNLIMRAILYGSSGEMGLPIVEQVCVGVEHPSSYIASMGKTLISLRQVPEYNIVDPTGILVDVPRYTGDTLIDAVPGDALLKSVELLDLWGNPENYLNSKQKLMEVPTGNEIASGLDGVHKGDPQSNSKYVWHNTSDRIKVCDPTGIMPGYMLVLITTPDTSPLGHHTVKAGDNYITIERPDWVRDSSDVVSNIIVKEIDTRGIIKLSQAIPHCYGKTLTFVPNPKFWCGPIVKSITNNKITLSKEIELSNNTASQTGTPVFFTKATPSYVNMVGFQWSKLFNPPGGAKSTLVFSQWDVPGLLYNGYNGYAGDNGTDPLVKPINEAVKELYNILYQDTSVMSLLGFQKLQSNSFTEQIQNVMVNYFFVDFFNFNGGIRGNMSIYDTGGESEIQPSVSMFAVNAKVSEKSIQLFQKQESYLTDLLEDLKASYDYLDKQKLILQDDHEATLTSLQSQKELAKKSLSDELDLLHQQLEYHMVRAIHRNE